MNWSNSRRANTNNPNMPVESGDPPVPDPNNWAKAAASAPRRKFAGAVMIVGGEIGETGGVGVETGRVGRTGDTIVCVIWGCAGVGVAVAPVMLVAFSDGEIGATTALIVETP